MKVSISILIIFFIGSFTLWLDARKRNEKDFSLPYHPTPLQLKIPAGWPKPSVNIFSNNPLTEEGFQLGRKLFYDGPLAKMEILPVHPATSSLQHLPLTITTLAMAFMTSLLPATHRHYCNLAWATAFHWDGGVNHIEVQALSPMTAPNEMAENVDSVLKKIKKDSSYRRMFKAAFGSNVINSQRMLKALAQFAGSLVSSDSKYDKVKRGEDKFNPTEQRGYELFKLRCNTCHKEPLFTDQSFRNNGLTLNNFLKDYGRMRITGNPGDSLKFKVPSLRNVSVTYPYMHDGRLYSLANVIDHYNNGIQMSATLDSSLRKGVPFTTAEKNDLIYFLHTLKDTSFFNDKRFSQP